MKVKLIGAVLTIILYITRSVSDLRSFKEFLNAGDPE
jgi:hypothetical protein